MTKNKNNSQTTINIIGFSCSLLIILIGFFIKSNSLKIIGFIIGISTGIYTQLAPKKLEQEAETPTTLPESETSEVIPPSPETIEEKQKKPETPTILPKSETPEVTSPSPEIIEEKQKENVIKCQYLEDEEIIKQTIDQLSNHSILWLDTETADWDKPTKRLSLLQITANPNDLTGESIYLLDLLDKNHLIDYFIQTIMVNENIQKVFHNAPYDVRFLGETNQVKNIFCTYSLSRRLSLEELGTPNRQLKTLARDLCGFTIEENEQGSDWAIRPLTEQQIKYAVMDVIFLTQVHQKLENINSNSLNFEEELERLLTIRNERNYQRAWVYYQIRNQFDLDLEKLKTIGQALGYHERWAIYQYQEIIEHENNNNSLNRSTRLTNNNNDSLNRLTRPINNNQNAQNLSSNSLNITESAILFRITRTYSPDLTPEELYDATRGNWVLQECRENADYAFAVYRGIVKQVYRIHSWHFSGVITNGNERYCFEGEIAEDKQHYIGMNVAHYFPRGYRYPTQYVNC